MLLLQSSSETQAIYLKMASATVMHRTVLDLPDDILTIICDFVNAEGRMFVDADLMQLLLTHSRFLQAAQARIQRHQSYAETCKSVTIDTTYGSSYDMHGEDSASQMGKTPTNTTFDSAVMMLIAMHKGEILATYVRSLNYIVSPEEMVQGVNRRKVALEEFASSEDSLQEWIDSLEPMVDTQAQYDLWVRHLLDRDDGEGLSILLEQMPHLHTLQLGGYRYRWIALSGLFARSALANYASNFEQYSSKCPIPSVNVRRLVLSNVHSIPDAFFAFEGRLQVTQSIRQLVIHCDPRANQPGSFFWWFRTPRDDDAWLKIPDIKIYGYQAGFSNLGNAIRRVQPNGFHRLEVVFSMPIEGGVRQAKSEIGPSFRIVGLQRPAFSNEAGKRIKMVLNRDHDRKHDNPKGSRSKARPSLRMSLDEFEA